MAHFYGVLQGSRGKATRCGTRYSGMEATAASWSGAGYVKTFEADTPTRLRDGNTDGREDHVTLGLIPWHGEGVNIVLYHGVVNPVTRAEMGRGLLPWADADTLRKVAAVLLARAEQAEQSKEG